MADYIDYVQNNMIPSCPITKEDIKQAEDILGPNLVSLKGKTVIHEVIWTQFRSIHFVAKSKIGCGGGFIFF